MLLIVLMVVGMIGFSATSVAAAPTLTLDGKTVNAKIFTKSKIPMFPVRLVCEQLGYTYSYKGGKATITTSDDVLTMTKGSRYFYDSSKTKFKLGTYPVLQSSILYAPAEFFTDLLGMSYTKDTSGNYALKSATAVTPTTPAPGATATPAPGTALGNVYLNDKQLSANAYQNARGYQMVQLQPIVQALGGTVTQSNTTSIVTIGNSVAYVDPASIYFSWGGQNYTLLTLPEMSNGALYVPVGFIEKVFSATILYSNNICKIYTSIGIAQSEFNVRLNNTLLSAKGYYNVAGKVMLPVKVLGEALGYTYSYDGYQIRLVQSTSTVTFIPGQTTYYPGYAAAQTFGASETRNNIIYVPIDMVTALMGVKGYTFSLGELLLSTTGATGGVQLQIKKAGSTSFTGASVYGKQSANGQTVMIPITTLLGDFGYLGTMSTSGVNAYSITKPTGSVNINGYGMITVTVGSSTISYSNGSSTLTYTAPAPVEYTIDGGLYLPIEVLINCMGVRVGGSTQTALQLSIS